MQEMINDLLGAEQEAQKLVQAAEEEARALRSRLENEYSQKINEAREEARKAVQRAVEKVRCTERAEEERTIAEANERGNSLWLEKQAQIDDVIDAIVSFLVTPEYEKE